MGCVLTHCGGGGGDEEEREKEREERERQKRGKIEFKLSYTLNHPEGNACMSLTIASIQTWGKCLQTF